MTLLEAIAHCFWGCSNFIKSLIWMLNHHSQQPQKRPREWCLMGRCDKNHGVDLDLSHVLIFCLHFPSLLPSLYLAFQIQRHEGKIQIFHYFGVSKYFTTLVWWNLYTFFPPFLKECWSSGSATGWSVMLLEGDIFCHHTLGQVLLWPTHKYHLNRKNEPCLESAKHTRGLEKSGITNE